MREVLDEAATRQLLELPCGLDPQLQVLLADRLSASFADSAAAFWQRLQIDWWKFGDRRPRMHTLTKSSRAKDLDGAEATVANTEAIIPGRKKK